jgi:hypothetical protein
LISTCSGILSSAFVMNAARDMNKKTHSLILRQILLIVLAYNAYNNVKKRARASFFHSEQSERC